MPIYEYDCPKCGVIEVMQSITEAPLAKCPDCHRKVKRLISLNNFHLKGTGWYATDYAGKKGKGANGKGADREKSEKKPKESAASETKASKPTAAASTASDK